MKLKMNKISGIYEGPPGVFYDVKYDEIFALEWDGCEIYRKNVGVVGRLFYYHRKGETHRKIAMTGFEYTTYLGELGEPFRNK